nr:serine hydrolase domain-containing protein [Candidatus Palauibacterales bacterium]
MRRILLLLALPTSLAAQQPDLRAVADSVFRDRNASDAPGCAVGVARGGTVLLTRAYGMADLESGRANTVATIFESGSVAKQFTAAATVLLAVDGKLNLDDPVQKYLPELPTYDRPLTIRHLLTHTSGLREWSSLVAAQGWPRGTRRHTQTDLFDVVTRQQALNYPVGDYYSYTNSGFGLLFTIVERVSGMSFQEFSQERLFRPLGMAHTRWRDDFTAIVPERAQAYAPERDGWHLDMPFEDVVGPGGLLTTVGDLLRWNEALTNRTLGTAVVDSMSHQMRLTSGREIQYGLGLFFMSYRGISEVSHSGSTAGYRTYLARYPDHGNLSVAVLCNAANANAGAYAHALVDALVTD